MKNRWRSKLGNEIDGQSARAAMSDHVDGHALAGRARRVDVTVGRLVQQRLDGAVSRRDPDLRGLAISFVANWTSGEDDYKRKMNGKIACVTRAESAARNLI
jgi:hypothetical protein